MSLENKDDLAPIVMENNHDQACLQPRGVKKEKGNVHMADLKIPRAVPFRGYESGSGVDIYKNDCISN